MRIPCAIFTKFAEFVPRFRMRLLLKFHWICSRVYGVMGNFSLTGSGSPKFSVPTSGETMRQTPNDLEVQERARGPLSPCQVWLGSDFFTRRTLSFLSVRHCFSVHHAFERQSLCARFRHEGVGWSTDMILMPLYSRRFVVVHPCSTSSDCRKQSTSLNAEVQKTAKIGGFSPPEGDRINRSRRILTRKCTLWVKSIAHQI